MPAWIFEVAIAVGFILASCPLAVITCCCNSCDGACSTSPNNQITLVVSSIPSNGRVTPCTNCQNCSTWNKTYVLDVDDEPHLGLGCYWIYRAPGQCGLHTVTARIYKPRDVTRLEVQLIGTTACTVGGGLFGGGNPLFAIWAVVFTEDKSEAAIDCTDLTGTLTYANSITLTGGFSSNGLWECDGAPASVAWS